MDDVTTDTARDLLLDGFDRIRDGVPQVVDGLSVDELLWRPDADANHIAWLVWHLARQQDDQVAHLAGEQSAWLGDGWVDRFGLPYPPRRPRVEHELGGRRPVHRRATRGSSASTTATSTTARPRCSSASTRTAYARVIDAHWDPPVTVAIRIVSVLGDAMKHLGQAEYVRGLVERRR